MTNHEFIAIIDFGSQYTQLIARRVREANVYCEILPPNVKAHHLAQRNLRGIILSGGPSSVYAHKAPVCEKEILELPVPILGICYGMQLGSQFMGSRVRASKNREYGRTEIKVLKKDPLLSRVPKKTTVWMSHGDRVESLEKNFTPLASTPHCQFAAVKHKKRPFYGVQFHPEVHHTPQGSRILRNFLEKICRCSGDWRMKNIVRESIREISETVGKDKVLCGLSGGVDSSVVAALLQKAIGSQLTCVFVDNGLCRKNEAKEIRAFFKKKMKLRLIMVDASETFLRKLKGVSDPEKKRKIIGHVFIDTFKTESKKIKKVKYLAQGTLYPDVIESQSAFGGPSVKIKTHHNVGGLPEKLGFKLIEPLRTLFKDEVREMGRELGLPDELVSRQPFPGPGLAVRYPGAIDRTKLDVLRDADEIVRQEVEKAGLHKMLWQYFAVLLPVSSVGVMGDSRTYENVAAVRACESVDGMTADWARLPHEVLATISSRIINEVQGINRVVYDISSKPPSTIEWE
jgi:GMP synthase (glutamine-hydrolysing)